MNVFPPSAFNPTVVMRQAFSLFQNGRLQEAHAACLKVLQAHPKHFDALQLMGGIALTTGNIQPAIHLFTLALEVHPRDAQMYYNRALAFERLRQTDSAIRDCNSAIEINPNLGEVHYRLGILYSNVKLDEKSLQHYDKAISINPNLHYIHGSRLLEAMKMCDWTKYQEQLEFIAAATLENKKVSPPFAVSALSDNPSVQKRSAQTWSKHEYPNQLALGPLPRRARGAKIRIGYFSSDFRNHPVSYLTAEIFEDHDREKFDVIAFSLSGKIDDEMQNRLRGAFDSFHDIPHLNDIQAAHFARSQNLDIAIDLGGHTENSRFGIFCQRVAPVQVSYIGYLGTTGAECIDYLIADSVLIPKHLRNNYTEQIAFLPIYQANDSKSRIAGNYVSRSNFKLPEDAFVFCCFNSIYKINPSVLDSWSRILDQCENSLLFLAVDDVITRANLLKEFDSRTIRRERVFFGHSLARPDFLARFKVADLFLDTWPCNGGTTSSEALWAGLPLITLAGSTFASRMGASLLTALQMDELISNSQQEYEQLAIDLYKDTQRLRSLSQKLRLKSQSSVLFNSAQFTPYLEKAYATMLDTHFSGKPAQDFFV